MFAPILMSSGGSLQVSSGVSIHLQAVDYIILFAYFAFVVGIGFALQRLNKTSDDFFLSGRSIPAWVTGLAFLSANLGAQEVLGMAASGAKYGMMTSHFYWVGAIPAMVFLAVFMMPFYYGSKARSVPEYLKLRFDEKTRTFNSLSFAAMTVFSSGISLHVLAKLLQALLGWDYNLSILACSAVVLVYVLKGGLTSAIYNEVLQFFMIVLGFAPLVWLGLRDVGGWSGLVAKLEEKNPAFIHSWAGMGTSNNPMGVEWFGMVFGLGFVLSFGYWCTDFLVVQRAMAAKSMGAARRTPIIGAVPKMIFPVLVILPGIIAYALTDTSWTASWFNDGSGYAIPGAAEGSPDYNMVMPSLLAHYLPSGLLGLGMTALMASFMSGMAGNVTAFNTVWTYDIYQTHLAPNREDSHYLWMGRAATVVGIIISIGCAYLASAFNNIMDMLQLIFAFVNAPLFATFLLGMFWKRATGHGAFFGLVLGTAGAAVFHGLSLATGNTAGIKGGWLLQQAPYTYWSEMAQNFWMAIVAFVICFTATVVISLATKRDKSDGELQGLVYSLTPKPSEEGEPWYIRPGVVGSIVLVACVFLNWYFW
jgi:SSS family solute:Na+ symporter